MAINSSPGVWVAIVALALMLAMAVAVFAVRPRRRANQGIFLFGVGTTSAGSVYFLTVGQANPAGDALWYFAAAGLLLESIGTLVVVFSYPTALRREERRSMSIPLAAAAAYAALAGFNLLRNHDMVLATYGMEGPHAAAYLAFHAMFNVLATVTVFCSLFLPLRYAHSVRLGRPAPGHALVTAGLLVWLGIVGGVSSMVEDGMQINSGAIIVTSLISAVAWLVVCRDAPRLGRNMALWLVALPTVGLLAVVYTGSAGTSVSSVLFGAARVATMGLLSIAILRHQLLGFDVKVRWTISRGTIAAAFIAVFFVVSELAAELLGGTSAGPILGIVAAGVLVFFLAPLQRWADRVAGSATGDAKEHARQSQDERLSTYHDIAASAWADGNIDAKERALLDSLRASLGLTYEQASHIETEAAGQ